MVRLQVRRAGPEIFSNLSHCSSGKRSALLWTVSRPRILCVALTHTQTFDGDRELICQFALTIFEISQQRIRAAKSRGALQRSSLDLALHCALFPSEAPLLRVSRAADLYLNPLQSAILC